MSLKARRYQERQAQEYGLTIIQTKTSKHHVPPRHPDKQPHFIFRVDDRHHRAYHLLFKAAKSFEDCVEILRNDWWTAPEKQPSD